MSDLGISSISMSDKLSFSRGDSGAVISSFLTGYDMLPIRTCIAGYLLLYEVGRGYCFPP